MKDSWVFGYGSLMWRPGFRFAERRPALLRGLCRQLCIYSHVHRGTPDRPGLVMGLDRGGACRGIAYRVAAEDWPSTLTYLRAREQVTAVYIETRRRVRLVGDGEVEALVYVVNRKHPQYAGRLGLDDQLKFVRQGCGASGTCADYVASTVEHLRELGIADHVLEALFVRLAPVPA